MCVYKKPHPTVCVVLPFHLVALSPPVVRELVSQRRIRLFNSSKSSRLPSKMVQLSLLYLVPLLPLVLADEPPQAGWGPGRGPGGGGPPPWGPGRPGGPWATAAPGPAPADPGCTARPACNSASAAAQSCSNRAAATGGSVYNDCLCQPGPSSAIQACYTGCFGAGGPIWLAQCTPAPAPGGGAGGGGGSVSYLFFLHFQRKKKKEKRK